MKKQLIFIALITLWGGATMAQTTAPVVIQNIPPASVTKTLFNKEQSFGAMITTSGWGLNFRSGKAKGAKTRQMLSLEFTTYRHPKEIKVKSVLDASQKYRYGKIATPYFIRASAGVQKVLFDKETPNAIQVRYLLMAGPSLVLAKPYYVEYKSRIKFANERVSVPFDPLTTTTDSIYGGSNFFTGIGRTLPYPAIHAKAALSFEYAGNDEDIKALEIGANIDYLPIPLKVFAYENRRPVFFQIYVSFNFGSRWY
jgi:hypothetical protein